MLSTRDAGHIRCNRVAWDIFLGNTWDSFKSEKCPTSSVKSEGYVHCVLRISRHSAPSFFTSIDQWGVLDMSSMLFTWSYPTNANRFVANQFMALGYCTCSHNTVLILHPPYQPDMALCDFFLFMNKKTVPQGHPFASLDEIMSASYKDLFTPK